MSVFSESYLIAMPADYELASFKTVFPHMLKNEPLIIFPRRLDPKLHERMMTEVMSGGYKPAIVQEAATKQTTLALVEAGLGIAFVPESIARVRRKGIEFREFSAALPKIEIYAIWRKENKSPLLAKFIKCMDRLLRLGNPGKSGC